MNAREAETFISRLRDEIRTYALEEMPSDSSGELAEMDLSDLLIVYGNWRGRYVAARPRRLHESLELQTSAKYLEHATALTAVRDDITAGRDLRPRLSKRVKRAYMRTGKRRALWAREDLDLLLADWGIHHLHLGVKRDGERMESTGDVLFAYSTPDDAYLIDVRGHPGTANWAEAGIMAILIRNFPELAHCGRPTA